MLRGDGRIVLLMMVAPLAVFWDTARERSICNVQLHFVCARALSAIPPQYCVKQPNDFSRAHVCPFEAKTNTKWTRERHVCITLAAIFMEVEKKC